MTDSTLPPIVVGQHVQLDPDCEALVLTVDAESVDVLLVTGDQVYSIRTVKHDEVSPAEKWRDDLVPGDTVSYLAYKKWHPCHVYEVQDDTIKLNPVLSHALIECPRNSLRFMRNTTSFPRWNVNVGPEYVTYANTRFGCYHATKYHYCVDTRHGRAYFPKIQCVPTAVPRTKDPVVIGRLFFAQDRIPQEVMRKLDAYAIMDILFAHAPRGDKVIEGLHTLMYEEFPTHTFRPWSSHVVADQLDLAIQINDTEYVGQLLDIASYYTFANLSHRLTTQLRARRLVDVNVVYEGNKSGFRIAWNHHVPRASTMAAAVSVLRLLESSPRQDVRLVDPYTVSYISHPFLNRYQLATFQNMLSLERTCVSSLFTYKVGRSYCNDYTGVSQPLAAHGGGCLAADVGLGKTVMICALILKNPATTLVIVPLSLLTQWEVECETRGILTWVSHGKRTLPTPNVKSVKRMAASLPKHTICPRLVRKMAELYALQPITRYCQSLEKVRFLYPQCHKKAMRMCERSCIVTTPAMFRARYLKFRICKRIVIDEAHRFKTTTTTTVRRIHELMPAFLWCVTATPPQPLHLAKLLNVYPGAKIEQLSPADQQQMDRITLRLERSKLEKAGQLERIPVFQYNVNCEPTQIYVRTFSKYTDIVLGQLSEGDFNKREIRQMVHDLEQMCVHTDCVPLYRYGTKVDVDTASLDRIMDEFQFDEQGRTRVKQTIAALETCALCLESYERPTVTSCGHVYCRECVTSLKKHTTKCPQCRCDIKSFLELDDNASKAQRVVHLGQVYHMPDKIDKEEGDKVKHIERIIGTGPTVVCSRHVSVIKYLGKRFKGPTITGKTSKRQRLTALQRFDTTGVLFITERSAGVGLCLQKANNVVFVEPAWNESVRKQVVGRVKRIGQTKPIDVWTLVCKNSIDVESVWEQCCLSTIGSRS